MSWSHITTNWRTSCLGAGAILGAVADVLHQLGTGSIDPVMLKADALAVATGWGLIMAKDGNVTGGTVKQ
jgi:hypothetical protein